MIRFAHLRSQYIWSLRRVIKKGAGQSGLTQMRARFSLMSLVKSSRMYVNTSAGVS